MKQFDDFKNGDLVVYNGNVYESFKSQYTHNAFRLKSVNGLSDEIVDISEIKPFYGERYEKPDSDIRTNPGLARGLAWEEYQKRVDSDADFTGIYDIQD